MKLNTLSALLLVAAGSMCCTSCDLGTAGSALANAYVNQLASGQGASAGSVAGEALKTLLSNNEKYGNLGLIAGELLKSFTNKGTAFNYSGTDHQCPNDGCQLHGRPYTQCLQCRQQN